MADTTTRISGVAHGILRELSRAEGKPMLELLDEAVEALRRQRFLESVNAAYASLRSNPRTWEKMEAERHAWDATLADGLTVGEKRASYGVRPRRRQLQRKR